MGGRGTIAVEIVMGPKCQELLALVGDIREAAVERDFITE